MCIRDRYRKFGGENYLEDAKMLYKYIVGSLLKSDGRVEEPPLTYTQGTFGEACRQLDVYKRQLYVYSCILAVWRYDRADWGGIYGYVMSYLERC